MKSGGEQKLGFTLFIELQKQQTLKSYFKIFKLMTNPKSSKQILNHKF
jgi:hypothetical protein